MTSALNALPTDSQQLIAARPSCQIVRRWFSRIAGPRVNGGDCRASRAEAIDGHRAADFGIGRFGGKAAIARFTDLRSIAVRTTPRHCPF
jgi:hypothetical protein